MTVIATGFESGAPYRTERTVVSFASKPLFTNNQEDRGAKIPPFLLNRQSQDG